MENKRRFGFIFVFAGALILSGSSWARGQGIGDRNRPADSNGGIYSIQGRVMPDGKPAKDVKVSISSTDELRSTIADVKKST